MFQFLPLPYDSGGRTLVVLPPNSIGLLILSGHRSPIVIMKGGHPDTEGQAIALGVYSLSTLTIHIDPQLAGPQLISTIIHEVAHAIFHLTGWGNTHAGTEADVALLSTILFKTELPAQLAAALQPPSKESPTHETG